MREVIGNKKHTVTINKINADDQRQTSMDDNWGHINVKHPKESIPGSDACIDMDWGKNYNTVINPKTGKAASMLTPVYISYAHELIHALRDMEGISIPEPEYGSSEYNRYTKLNIVQRPIAYQEYREELTTIGTDGLGYKYTENMIRREHHLPLRISHVTDTSEFPVMK